MGVTFGTRMVVTFGTRMGATFAWVWPLARPRNSGGDPVADGTRVAAVGR
jgi:hypothetical protein